MSSTLSRAERAPETTSSRLNKLRAGVLGANDGIVSVAATVIGVAAATQSVPVIATAGFAALAAGAFSMAAGEYISVSTQRDTERALVERTEGLSDAESEEIVTRLAAGFESRGMSAATAQEAAREMTYANPVEALGTIESIDPEDFVNPWHAAWASFFSFIAGALLPLMTILLSPVSVRVPVTFVSVLVALALTGLISANLGGADSRRAMRRTVIGGAIAMAATYGIGTLFDVQVS